MYSTCTCTCTCGGEQVPQMLISCSTQCAKINSSNKSYYIVGFTSGIWRFVHVVVHVAQHLCFVHSCLSVIHSAYCMCAVYIRLIRVCTVNFELLWHLLSSVECASTS